MIIIYVLIRFFSLLCFQVFHKIITNGHQRLQPLFDCLLTIIVNGKSLSQARNMIYATLSFLVIIYSCHVLNTILGSNVHAALISVG